MSMHAPHGDFPNTFRVSDDLDSLPDIVDHLNKSDLRGEGWIEYLNALEALQARWSAGKTPNHLELFFGENWEERISAFTPAEFLQEVNKRASLLFQAAVDYREMADDGLFVTRLDLLAGFESYIAEGVTTLLSDEKRAVYVQQIKGDTSPADLSDIEVPKWTISNLDVRGPLWGSETAKAISNWNGSPNDTLSSPAHSELIRDICPELITSIAIVKEANALAMYELGQLNDVQLHDGTKVPSEIVRDAIVRTCREIVEGRLSEHFPLSTIQGGAYTSLNMNLNEVIANRANQRIHEMMELESPYYIGSFSPLHPNDHINNPNSTNDVIPTAMKLAFWMRNQKMLSAFDRTIDAIAVLSSRYEDALKQARTHLQDAVGMTVGQEFGSWVAELLSCRGIIQTAANGLQLNSLGAGAIGTELNSPDGYRPKVNECYTKVLEELGIDFKPTQVENYFQSTWGFGGVNNYARAIGTFVDSLDKIMNDLRLEASGPNAGLGEDRLPAQQKGSSIMPGKINPVIPEMVNQVCMICRGYAEVVSQVARGGQLQLNVFESAAVFAISEMQRMLEKANNRLVALCLEGLEVNTERAEELFWKAGGFITGLTPIIGYEKTTNMYLEMVAEKIDPRTFFTDPDVLRRYEISEEEALAIKRIIENPLLIIKDREAQ